MPAKKMPKLSPPLAPKFFRVTDPDTHRPIRVNLSWVRYIETGTAYGQRGPALFLVIAADMRFAVSEPKEIAELAAILGTTVADLTS